MHVARNFLIAFVTLGLVATSSADAHPQATMPTDSTIADVAERVVDSVVNIAVEAEVPQDPFWSGFWGDDSPQKMEGKGSGVIVTASGRILTNAHVINQADEITVTLQDGTELSAKVIGKDPLADLAVLQLEGKLPPLKPLAFGDSAQLRLGEIVLAVGDGMGVGKSVSMGIVSAKGRGLRIAAYEDFIQTDAAINPGNSGGALVNLKGELVGINTAIASRSGGYQGIGFAIPTNMARPIMDQLMKEGKVSRGYLGIGIETVSAQLAKRKNLPTSKGVRIDSIESKGPAAKAGLAEDDVITGINGTEMRTDTALRNAIAMTKPGTTVDLQVVRRDGKTVTIKAKLGEQPDRSALRRGTPQRPPRVQRFTLP